MSDTAADLATTARHLLHEAQAQEEARERRTRDRETREGQEAAVRIADQAAGAGAVGTIEWAAVYDRAVSHISASAASDDYRLSFLAGVARQIAIQTAAAEDGAVR